MRVLILALLAMAPAAWAQTVIVYSRLDAAAAKRVGDLVAAYDAVTIYTGLPPGSMMRQEMDAAIRRARVVIVMWSANAAASVEVGAEWRMAVAGTARVVPMLLDDAPLPPELAARRWIDWRPRR